MRRLPSLLVACCLALPSVVAAQRQAEVDAINRLIDRYGALEDSMDMAAQAQLMAADRVWVAQGAGRRTDQATNMRIQQANYDAIKRTAPGVRTFTEDRDRVIRFYADGAVAVASFYRYTTVIPPANTPPEVASALAAGPPAVATVVLEKRGGEWKIVHTHFSSLTQAPGN